MTEPTGAAGEVSDPPKIEDLKQANDEDEAMEASNGDARADKPQDESTDGADAAVSKKNYKTTLCQYYLKGPCKNGDTCSYAHGTSELRTQSGLPVSEVAGDGSETNGDKSGNKYKTTLCSRFVTHGNCPFGNVCNFAHGVQELRLAAESVAQEANHGPNYKRVLCKNYMQGMYCPFGDKCQFAHGRYDLRTDGNIANPATKMTSQLSNEEKQRRLEKAKKMPGYKTKLCQNFERNQTCEFAELCLYAHGSSELRESNPGNDSGPLGQVQSKPSAPGNDGKMAYKTTLCKNFAEMGGCPFGNKCQFAHGQMELRPPGNPKFKTQLCQHMVNTGSCPRGNSCAFAHSMNEQRSSGQPFFGAVQKPGLPPKYKTTMCTAVVETGICSRGEDCHFAHSMAELRAAQGADPKFKTEMCVNFIRMGYCERENNCKFAHGEIELRPVRPPNAILPVYVNSGRNQQPIFKQDNYKTSMCRNATNGSCPRGDACNFAHGVGELRSSHYDYNHGAPSNNFGQQPFGMFPWAGKRKTSTSGGVKTTVCQNFSTFGHCQYGDMCLYAHSESELLPFNKRQRF